MVKYKKYGYWYWNWDTYNVKHATHNRRVQWHSKNWSENNFLSIILLN